MNPFNHYPFYIPFLRNLFNIALVSLGLWTLAGLHPGLAVVYALYCLAMVLLIMPRSRCTKCFYHGRRCSTGFGLVAGLLYSRDRCHSFTDGLWYNLFLPPVAIFPLTGALWRIIFYRDSQCLWLGIGLSIIILGLLTEQTQLCFGVCR